MTYVNLDGLKIKADSLNDFVRDLKRKLDMVDQAINELNSLRSQGIIECRRRLEKSREKLITDIRTLEQLARVLEESEAIILSGENKIEENARQSGFRFKIRGVKKQRNIFNDTGIRVVPIIT